MILKSSRIANINHARKMGAHLLKDENEVVQVWESDTDGVENTLVDFQLYTKVTQGNRGIYHVAISPREDETMTREQWSQAVEAIEQKFGLSGQPRVQVYHEKEGRPHLHVCWSMVDFEKRKLIDIGRGDHFKLQELATELEREFGHELTERAANDNTIEITAKDRARESRTGKSAKARKELMREIWQRTSTHGEFVAALEKAGYILSKGDKCRFAITDRDGDGYNLVRDLPKLIKVKDVAARVNEKELISAEEARAIQEQGREAPEKPIERESEEKHTQATEILNDPLEAAQERFTGHKEAFREQEAERLTRDAAGKSLETATDSRSGETLSPDGTRKQRQKISANTLLGVMAAYTALPEQERQEIRQELEARLKADEHKRRYREVRAEREQEEQNQSRDFGREREF